MKNLTVNMPLAVPHQRPPSKYASHPYAVLDDTAQYVNTISKVSGSIDVIKFPDDEIHYSLLVLDATIVQVVFPTIDYYGYGCDSYVTNLNPLDIEIKDVALPILDFNQNINEELIYKISPKDIEIKNIFNDIYYNERLYHLVSYNIKPLDIIIESNL